MTAADSYNELPFTSFPSPERHPARLRVIGRLFGLDPAPLAQARVLELGCGTGMNLLPIAASYPGARFTGFDLAAGQIAMGNKWISELGLKNIELKAADLTALDMSAGEFDYIICHGLYSWADSNVQRSIFDLCRGALAPNGLVLVSFNCLPGWELRGTIRDRVRSTDQPSESAKVRVARAREVLKLISDHQVDDHTPYGMQLREELQQLQRGSDALIFHEMLAPTVEALSFSEFTARTNQAELQYVSDAKFSRNLFVQTSDTEIPGVVEDGSATAAAFRENFFDGVYPRSFRSAVICRAGAPVRRSDFLGRLGGLHVASPLVTLEPSPDIEEDRELDFFDPREHTYGFRDPVIKALLLELSECWPETRPIEDLIARSAKRVRRKVSIEAREEILGSLFQLFRHGVIEFYAEPAPLTVQVGERPKLSDLTRMQAKKLGWATTFRHEFLPAREFESRLIQLLDGTRHVEELARELTAQAAAGDLKLSEDGEPVTDPARQAELIAEQVGIAIEQFRRAGLFLPHHS